jgi:hypothetical protein
LTTGAWEITRVELSVDRKTFYLTSTEAGAGERHLYSMASTGGTRTRLTTAVGEAGARLTIGGARDVRQVGDVSELDRIRMVTVFTADA